VIGLVYKAHSNGKCTFLPRLRPYPMRGHRLLCIGAKLCTCPMWLDSVHVSCCIVHLHVQFGMVNSTTEYLLMCSFSFKSQSHLQVAKSNIANLFLTAEHCAQSFIHSCLGHHFHTLVICHRHVENMSMTVAPPGTIKHTFCCCHVGSHVESET